MKWSYPVLAFAVLFIIGFGLINLIKEDLELAPWAESSAEEGRLMANTKNVTRLVNEGAADLHAYLQTAVPYAEEDGGISGELDAYAFSQRADWFVTPSEGPFRHF